MLRGATWGFKLASMDTDAPDSHATECERLRAENIELRTAAKRLLRTLSVCGYDGCRRAATKESCDGKYRMCDEHVPYPDEYNDTDQGESVRELTALLEAPALK